MDSSIPSLKSPPAKWQQVIQIVGNCVSVREEIARADGRSVAEVVGAFDGNFYRIKGSPLIEEIAYTSESGCIQGTGRKQGAVVLQEVVSLLDPDTLNLALTVFPGGKEWPLGNAVFRRVQRA